MRFDSMTEFTLFDFTFLTNFAEQTLGVKPPISVPE